MKNLLLGMLAMAAMVSCSSENDPIDDVAGGKQDKVEIKLNAGVVGVETKSPVVSWSNTEVSFANKTGGTGSYATTTPWFAKIADGGSVSFVNAEGATESHYYEADGSTTSLIGYYPRGTYNNGIVIYSLTGEEDIMVSQELSGDKNTPMTNTETKFKFEHLLSQLKFIVKSGENFGTGVKVTKIVLNGTNTSATLTLTGASPALTFGSDAAPLTIYDKAEGADIASSTAAVATKMVQPGVSGMTLDITAGGTEYTGIPITIANSNNAPDASTAYDITLTFSKKEVAAEAEIGEWKTGTGSADVF